jgi:hypothetical protein
MPLDTKSTVKLSELIHWVKKELLSDEALRDDPVPLFMIDEVTVEVNFVLSGEGEGGVDLQVVKAGAKVAEKRVQKAIVRMKSLVPYERVRERLGERHLRHLEDRVVRALVKGLNLPEQDVPPRE